MEIGEERAGQALVIAPRGRIDSVSSGELERFWWRGSTPAPGGW